MKEIKMKHGYIACVDDEDFENLNQHKWYATKHGNNLYATRSIRGDDGKQHTCFMHREIMNALKRTIVDHANGNGLDNRKNNLRFATVSQNRMNSRGDKNTSSKYKGVSWYKRLNKWQVSIKKDIAISLGRYSDEKDAAEAYNKKARELYGEFARLNQIEQ